MGGIIRLAEHGCGTGHEAGAFPEEVGVNQAVFRQVVGRAPVAKIQPVLRLFRAARHLHVHDAFFRTPALHEGELLLHGIVVLLQHRFIRIVTVVLPGDDVDGCAPGHSAAASGMEGGGVGHISAQGILAVGHVPEPFAVEGIGVEVLHHRHTGHLAVAGVGALLAVGAVGGHAHVHVICLGAPEKVVHPVYQGVGALEATGGADVGIDSLRAQILRLEFARPSFHHHLAEGIPVEGRSVAFASGALADVFVISVPGAFNPVIAGVFRIDGVQEFDFGALGSLDAIEMHAAGDVVAEVHFVGAVFLSGDALRLKDLHDSVCKALLQFECALRGLADDGRLPFLVGLQTGIIGLSAVDVIVEYGALAYLPGSIRTDGAGATVLHLDFYLAEQPRGAERRDVSLAPAGIPAVAQSYSDGIFALLKKASNIVGQIHHPEVLEVLVGDLDVEHVAGLAMAVHGVVGHVVVFPHALAVDGRLEHSEAADVHCGTLRPGIQADGFCEFRGRMLRFGDEVIPLPWRTYPFGLPFGDGRRIIIPTWCAKA